MKLYLIKALKALFLSTFMILFIAQKSMAVKVVNDSLKQRAIERIVKDLNQHIAQAKVSGGGGFLKDEAQMLLETNYQTEVSDVLKHLAKKHNRKLYVVTYAGPALVINDQEETAGLPNKMSQEAGELAQAIYNKTDFDNNSILLVFYYQKVITVGSDGFKGFGGVSYVSTDNSLNIAQEDLSEMVSRGNQLKTGNDYLRSILYSIVRVLAQDNTTSIQNSSSGLSTYAEAFLKDYNPSDAEVTALEVKLPPGWSNQSQDSYWPVPNGVKYGFTPSGKAFDISKFSKVWFSDCHGYVYAFMVNNVAYKAVMTKPGGQKYKCTHRAGTFFWGYYPFKDFEMIKEKYMQKNGFSAPDRWHDKTVGAFEGTKITLREEVFLPGKWFKLEKANPGGIALIRKTNNDYDDLGLENTCKTQYLLTLSKSYAIGTGQRGVGSVLNTIPEISEAKADNSDCKGEKIIKDALANGLKTGKGAEIYAHRYHLVKDDPEKVKTLIKYANEITEFLKNEQVALIRFEKKLKASGNFHTTSSSDIIKTFQEIDYATFKKSYPATFEARNAYLKKNTPYKVLASYNPWQEDKIVGEITVHRIPKNYNIYAIDHTGQNPNYEYSIQDLVERYKFYTTENSRIFSIAMNDAEKMGKAFPLSTRDNYDQYVAFFKTDIAWGAWAGYVTGVLGTIQQGVMSCLAGISKELSDLIAKGKAPETLWNPSCGTSGDACACKGTYSAFVKTMFELIEDQQQREKYQMIFAFLAGVYNALIDEGVDKVQQVNLFASFYSSPKKADAIWSSMEQLVQQGVWDAVKKEFTNSTCNQYKVSYTAGYNLLAIIGIGKGMTTVIKNMSSSNLTGKLLMRLKRTKQAVKDFNVKLNQLSIQAKTSLVEKVIGVYDIVVTKASSSSKIVIATLEKGKIKVKRWVTADATPKDGVGKISVEGEVELYVAKNKDGEVGVCLKDGTCFIAGTPIFTAQKTFSPIEKVAAGQKVYAENPKNCEVAAKPVETTFVRTTRQLIQLGFAKEIIYATPEHPFFNLKHQQVLAGNIHPGDTLKTYDSYAIVQQTRAIDTTATVYNFHVKDFQTYFVGKTRLLVHNMSAHAFSARIQSNSKLKERYERLTPDERIDFDRNFRNASNDEFRRLENNPRLVERWQFLDGSPDIRKNIANLENLDEVLEARHFESAGFSIENLKTGIKNSKSKAKMIERLKANSQEGSSVRQFAEAFSTAGREIDYKMTADISTLRNALPDINKTRTNRNFDKQWSLRQAADTKQAKIEASELLAEARVDQIYKSKGWRRLDVDGRPPGKQGKFDRVYAEYDANDKLVNLHVIEAKGGGGILGSRVIGGNKVAQQGTPEYKAFIIDNLLSKLKQSDKLRKPLEEAKTANRISYVLVKQGIDKKENFIAKIFPD